MGVSTAPGVDVAPAPLAGARAPSFEDVFRTCGALAWRTVRRLGVREADLEDVCQEVFVVVHKKLGTFAGNAAPSTWVYGICVRVASDYRKRAQWRREQQVDEVPEVAVPAEQEAEIDRRRALAWLDRVLDTLDDDKRAVFVLFEIEQIPMQAVAVATGCPLQTAYARLYAARKHVEAAARRDQAKRSGA